LYHNIYKFVSHLREGDTGSSL